MTRLRCPLDALVRHVDLGSEPVPGSEPFFDLSSAMTLNFLMWAIPIILLVLGFALIPR